MNILEIMRFIENLDSKYFKEINISKSVLYELKKSPKKLYKSKFVTVQTLYNYMVEFNNLNNVHINNNQILENNTFSNNNPIQIINNFEKDSKNFDDFGKNVIGIDIGVKNVLSASDHKREKTFTVTDQINDLNKYTQEYIKVLSQSKDLGFKTLKKSHREVYIKKIEGIINKGVKDCIKQFSNKSIFVIGEINYKSLSPYDPFYIIGERVINRFKNKLEAQNKFYIVNERETSITCPKCNNVNKNNRTKSNTFKCTNCNFKFEHDDILAASNIAKIFINRNIQ